MARSRSPTPRTLRGSVTQNTTVRLSPATAARGVVLLRLGLVATAIVVLIAGVSWLWHSGGPHRQVERLGAAALALTQSAHFAVSDVEVEGRTQTPREALSAALGVTEGMPIFAFDPIESQARVAQLPWVSSARIERHLPDTVRVRLVERVPLARWQRGGHVTIIDITGKDIAEARLENFTALPLIVGTGAAEVARSLFDHLAEEPTVARHLTAATWVGQRRWDLYLDAHTVVKMPEGDLALSLRRLATLLEGQNILERKVASVDLRFADRVIMETPPPTTAPSSGTAPP